MLVLVGGLLFTLASLRTQFESPHQPAYYGSLLLAVGGCALLVTLRDAVFLLLTWELTAVAAAGLLYFASLASESREAAVKHALPGLLASVTLWLGTALLCGLAGTVSVEPTTTHPT